MSTRCIVQVINHGQKRQYYRHCDGYLSGVGWELFRTYFGAFHGSGPGMEPYTRWVVERTKNCDLTEDIGCSYEPEPWEQYHSDIEFQYLLDFDKGTLLAKEIQNQKIYDPAELRHRISAEFHEKIAAVMEDFDEDNFLLWAREHKF